MWCCANSVGPWWGHGYLDFIDDDDLWPNRLWPEVLCFALLAFPRASPYAYIPLAAVWIIAAATIVQRVRYVYRTFRVQDRRSKIARGIKHAAERLLLEQGVAVSSLDEFRDGFTATMWREGHDAMTLRERLRETTNQAVARIQAGEWWLAWEPGCYSTTIVPGIMLRFSILLSGLFALTTSASGVTAAIAVAVAYRGCQLLSPVGLLLAQRLFAVSVAFDSARVTDISCHHEEHDTLRMTVMLDIVPRAS